MNQVTVTNLTELPYAMEEAINRLRVNVGFLGEDIRKVMIISTFPDEGKSLVALQLWRQMAEAGIPAVFLDADMRKSVLNEKNPLQLAEADKDSLYKFGDAQLSEEGIAVTAYALENTQSSDDADPFNITFSRYKDDKGVYKLTNK